MVYDLNKVKEILNNSFTTNDGKLSIVELIATDTKGVFQVIASLKTYLEGLSTVLESFEVFYFILTNELPLNAYSNSKTIFLSRNVNDSEYFVVFSKVKNDLIEMLKNAGMVKEHYYTFKPYLL